MLPLPSSPNSLVFCASVPARVRASDPAVGGAAGGLAGARERGAGAEGLAHAAGGQAEEETPDRGRGLGAERPQGLPGNPPACCHGDTVLFTWDAELAEPLTQ